MNCDCVSPPRSAADWTGDRPSAVAPPLLGQLLRGHGTTGVAIVVARVSAIAIIGPVVVARPWSAGAGHAGLQRRRDPRSGLSGWSEHTAEFFVAGGHRSHDPDRGSRPRPAATPRPGVTRRGVDALVNARTGAPVLHGRLETAGRRSFAGRRGFARRPVAPPDNVAGSLLRRLLRVPAPEPAWPESTRVLGRRRGAGSPRRTCECGCKDSAANPDLGFHDDSPFCFG